MEINILYINLDHRIDRKEEMESMLHGYNYERVSAIEDIDGYIGCAKSHIKCLEIARARKYKRVIILEDDFMFKANHNFNNMALPEDYDVFLLSNLIKKCVSINDTFNRIYNCEWTSGHIVNETIYDDLIQNVYEGIQDRLKNGKSRANNLDIYWMKLMKKYNFMSHKDCIGTQRPGYSDIKGENISRSN